jgi:hypothetical protein
MTDRDLIEQHAERIMVKPQAIEVRLGAPTEATIEAARQKIGVNPAPSGQVPPITITLPWATPTFTAVKGIIRTPSPRPPRGPRKSGAPASRNKRLSKPSVHADVAIDVPCAALRTGLYTHRTGLRRAGTEIGKYRAENATPNARFLGRDSVNALPETYPTWLRDCRRVSEAEHVPNRDWNGWLWRQSPANPSPDWIPCYQGKIQGILRLGAPSCSATWPRKACGSGAFRLASSAQREI